LQELREKQKVHEQRLVTVERSAVSLGIQRRTKQTLTVHGQETNNQTLTQINEANVAQNEQIQDLGRKVAKSVVSTARDDRNIFHARLTRNRTAGGQQSGDHPARSEV